MKHAFFILGFLCLLNCGKAQLKFVIEDFEGFANGQADLKKNGVFTFGNCVASIDHSSDAQNPVQDPDYLGDRWLTVKRSDKVDFGGWGKGIGLNIELDVTTDALNFYLAPGKNKYCNMRVALQEDDNDDNLFEKNSDDEWVYQLEAQRDPVKEGWQLISMPLKQFKDDNAGGDGVFNCNYKNGKLICLVISFSDKHPLTNSSVSLDFICFSKGNLSDYLKEPSPGDNFCSLGLWSKEGRESDFTNIGPAFKKMFAGTNKKELGVVHFFQPFAVDGGSAQNNYPSAERVNKVIEQGYTPMITLENHFVNTDAKMKQPNLYSIIEGHMDNFFTTWAKQIKQVKGLVLVRILHEFNGNWYPWCIVNNDKDPALFIKAYKHIRDIFNRQEVRNVKFIWCPNSMSVPQEKWNFIMDAYPGDDYVDCVGMDIYNGADQEALVWRSFRKEGIENYFLLTQRLPAKPLLVCETASRERKADESNGQTKEQWIEELSKALRSDMIKIRLLTWFNEKSTFKITSTEASQNAFLKYILKNDHFSSGTKYLYPLIR